jgi:hypothetical protein
VRSDNQQNKILRGIRPCRTKSCGVTDFAELSLAGYQTSQNNVLRGPDTPPYIVLRGINLKYEYLRELETEFKKISDCEFTNYMGWKKPEIENLMLLPF